MLMLNWRDSIELLILATFLVNINNSDLLSLTVTFIDIYLLVD